MLSIISSSKTMTGNSNSFEAKKICPKYSSLLFGDEINHLQNIFKNYRIDELKAIMGISDKLAKNVHDNWQNFNLGQKLPAILAYSGSVYAQLNRSGYSSQNYSFMQKHLLIISGLYGCLRPLDMIDKYRLEMSTDVNGKTLKNFWSETITAYFNNELRSHNHPYLINLASKEYSEVIDAKSLKYPVINIAFKENHLGKLKIIGVNAKVARGIMVEFIVQNSIDDPLMLKEFNLSYSFSSNHSDENNYIFIKNN